jgi:acyl-CoA thioester hydrolase
VVEVQARYRQPARYDDLIDIDAGPEELRAASVRFKYRLVRASDKELLCEGHTIHACLGVDRKVRRFPEELAKLLRPS